GRARLARDDEQRLAKIKRLPDGLDLRRHGGIENTQAWKAGLLTEHRGQDFRPKAGPNHAEQERVLEPIAQNLLGEGLVALDLIAGSGTEPAEPAIFGDAGPQRLVALP